MFDIVKQWQVRVVDCTLDEFTKIDADSFSALAFRITQGEDRGRLGKGTGGSEFTDSAYWQMSGCWLSRSFARTAT